MVPLDVNPVAAVATPEVSETPRRAAMDKTTAILLAVIVALLVVLAVVLANQRRASRSTRCDQSRRCCGLKFQTKRDSTMSDRRSRGLGRAVPPDALSATICEFK